MGSELLRRTSFQRDKAGLTCGSPSKRSGYSNGSNHAEIDEQVELEFHRGRVVVLGERKEGREGGNAPFISQTKWLKKGRRFTVTDAGENQPKTEDRSSLPLLFPSIAWAIHSDGALCARGGTRVRSLFKYAL